MAQSGSVDAAHRSRVAKVSSDRRHERFTAEAIPGEDFVGIVPTTKGRRGPSPLGTPLPSSLLFLFCDTDADCGASRPLAQPSLQTLLPAPSLVAAQPVSATLPRTAIWCTPAKLTSGFKVGRSPETLSAATRFGRSFPGEKVALRGAATRA